jgi:hypothetical protein
MGKKKVKSEQTNRPIYEQEVMGAARTQQDAYDQSKGLINQTANNMGRVSANLFDQYEQGDPSQIAARDFLTGALNQQGNPHLDQMIDLTNNRMMNQMQAQSAVRGRTGGSDYTNLITRALADNETGLRYQDFNNDFQRRLQAASLVPGNMAAGFMPLEMAMQTGQSGAMLPLQAALANSAGVGGLLGQYQDVKGKQVQSGGLLGSILSGFLQGGLGSIMGGGK